MAKTQRTLGPAAFEAYMDFADSLKDGRNDDSIDRFKYNFAVKEGYIRPRKARFEAASAPLTADSIKDAVGNLLSAFLPHLDSEEQGVLEGFLKNFDEKVNSGKNPFAHEDDDDDDAVVSDEDDIEECDGECPEGTVCKDGECVPEDDAAPADEECSCGKKNLRECGEGLDNAPAGTPGGMPADEQSVSKVDFVDDPGAEDEFGGPEYAFDDYTDEVDDHELDFRKDTGRKGGLAADRMDACATDEINYDELADQLLSDAGYDNMTIANGGVGKRNQKFFR